MKETPVADPGAPGVSSDDLALAAHQARSQRGFYRALADGSPGAALIDLEGVQATVVPVRPWFSIFNSVLYEDASALQAALPRLSEQYSAAGVMAWSVWVGPQDEAAGSLLEEAGFACDGGPLRMAATLGEIDLKARMDIDLVPEPTWEMVSRCNDRAHGALPDWTMAAVFEQMDDPASRLYAARAGSEVVAALIAREFDGDCYFWFVATVPESQRKGIGAELMRVALRDANERGNETTSLESTRAGERLYTMLGYRSLGRFQLWERKIST